MRIHIPLHKCLLCNTRMALCLFVCLFVPHSFICARVSGLSHHRYVREPEPPPSRPHATKVTHKWARIPSPRRPTYLFMNVRSTRHWQLIPLDACPHDACRYGHNINKRNDRCQVRPPCMSANWPVCYAIDVDTPAPPPPPRLPACPTNRSRPDPPTHAVLRV
jgi:hypothetical protein